MRSLTAPRRALVTWSALMVTAVLVIATLPLGMVSVDAQTTLPTVSGIVYEDADLSGAFDGADIGVAGVGIRAFDDLGDEVGTATTGSDGTWSLELATAHTGIVRVEFETPADRMAALVAGIEGASGSSIQFVAPGATEVNFGVFDPASTGVIEEMASISMNQGPLSYQSTNRVIGISPWNPPTVISGGRPVAADQSGGNVETLSTKADTGNTWGLAYQPATKLFWNSAFIRRHAALGPEGVGGLYVVNRDGEQVASFDLADLGLVLQDPGSDFSDTARDIREDLNSVISPTDPNVTYPARSYLHLSRDIPGYSAVGKVGVGDIDISDDGEYLWLTNLYERKIHRIALGGTETAPTLGAVQSWSVDDGHTCAGSTSPLRPFGLDPQGDGSVVVAAVCTNESANALDKPLPGDGVVLSIDPSATGAAAWTNLTSIDFDIPHTYDYCSTAAGFTCTWKAWSDDWSAMQSVAKTGSQYWWTQPMPVNIETLPDGSFVVGISDRMSYQGGNANFQPLDVANPGYQTAWTAGQVMLLCSTSTGWLQESGGSCSGNTEYTSARTGGFFVQDFGHPKTVIGGLAYGDGRVAIGSMDPANYFTGGIRWDSTTTGAQVNALDLWLPNNTSTTPLFGKSSGVGDLEAITGAAPLQIGNRIWFDIDGNGIQDPGEDPVVGVTIRLYDGDTLVATAVTNERGEYYFASNIAEPADGGADPDAFGGNLAAGVAYTVVMDNSEDCDEGGPLEGWILTQKNATTLLPEHDALIDSDATAEGSSWCGEGAPTVVIDALEVGTVDHSFDIGFWVPSVMLGQLVWMDTNDNGVIDPDEAGVPGVTLELTDAQGNPVVDMLGRPVVAQITDEFGRYRFPLLPLGQYLVTITVPEGYSLVDGESTTSNSVDLTEFGDVDRNLNFGLRLGEGPTPPPDPDPDDGGDGDDEVGGLPVTGSDALPLVLLGVALLVVGAGVARTATRRRSVGRTSDAH